MKEKFLKMLEQMKKEKGEIGGNDQKARLGVLEDLRDSASDAMGDKLMKVKVSSDSPEGVEKGLEKAQELVAGLGEQESPDMVADDNLDMEDDYEEEEMEGRSPASEEYDNLSKEELIEMLKNYKS